VSRPQSARWSWRTTRNSAVVASACFALSGCAASFSAQTLQPYQPAEGISNRSGQVYALDTLVVADGKGNGTVVSALINQRYHQDALKSVTASDDKGSPLKVQPLASGGIALPYGQSVQIGNSGAVRISGKRVDAGLFVTLTFTFAQAAPVTIKVPVLSRGSIYSKIPVGPTGSSTTTP
jgi:hypothetical protein